MNKEKLQQQLEEIKDKVAELEQELRKTEKFEFKYKFGNTYLVDTHYIDTNMSGKGNVYLENGRYRKTEKVAEDALALQRRVMRLHALVEQLDGFGGDYYIFYSEGDREWRNFFSNGNVLYPEGVLMTEECAKEICRMLNEGEVEL